MTCPAAQSQPHDCRTPNACLRASLAVFDNVRRIDQDKPDAELFVVWPDNKNWAAA